MTYLTVKYIKGNPYLYEVRSERTGDRVRQVFVRYLGRADTAEGMERQATYSGGEAVSVEPRKVAVPAVTKPVAVTPEVKEPEIISTPEIAKDYIIKKEPEPLLPSGFKYMVYQSDDTPMYISGATPEEAESKLKQGHKVASVKLESELEVTPTPEVTSIQQGIQDAVAEHTYRLEHAVSGKTTGYTGFWITKQGKIYQHDLLKDIPASEREGLVNIHSHSPIGWQQRLEEGRLDAFDPLGAGDVENLQTNVKNRWSDTMGVIMGDGRMEFLRVPDNAKTTFLRLSKAEIRKALSPTSTEGMRNALIQFAEENGLEYQTGLSWKGEPALPKAEVTPLITEKVTPEVTSTDISSEKFAVIQEALSELRGKGFVPTVTSFSIDPTIEETVRGEYSGETKSIAFRSEGGITPFLVEHELLHSIIAEARASKGNDFLVDYAKVAGFTGKGLEESITTEATIRIPVVEDLVRNMQVYLRHPEELPSSVRAFYDNLAETLAEPPVPKAEAIPEVPVTPEVTKIDATKLSEEEFTKYRNGVIEKATKTRSKRDVTAFIKAADKEFPISDVVAYRPKLQVVIREGNEDVLYDFSVDRKAFVEIQRTPMELPVPELGILDVSEGFIPSIVEEPISFTPEVTKVLDRMDIGKIIQGRNLDASATNFAVTQLPQIELTEAQVNGVLNIADSIRQISDKVSIGTAELAEAIQYIKGGGLTEARANFERLLETATEEDERQYRQSLERIKSIEAIRSPAIEPVVTPVTKEVRPTEILYKGLTEEGLLGEGGGGSWFTPDIEHAKKYGEKVMFVERPKNIKIFKTREEYSNYLTGNVVREPTGEDIMRKREELIGKGYSGVQYPESSGELQVWIFERPQLAEVAIPKAEVVPVVHRGGRGRYSPRQQTLTVSGEKVKQLPTESRSQYWDRIKELRIEVGEDPISGEKEGAEVPPVTPEVPPTPTPEEPERVKPEPTTIKKEASEETLE